MRDWRGGWTGLTEEQRSDGGIVAVQDLAEVVATVVKRIVSTEWHVADYKDALASCLRCL